MEKFDYSQNNYHPEKDKIPGAYEWWYFDGELHNGYTFIIVFSCTNPVGVKYAQALAKLAKDPTLAYNALDYATMKVTLMDANRQPVFLGEQDLVADQVRIANDRLDVYFGDKCHLTMQNRESEELPVFNIDVEIPDGKGNNVRAQVVFDPKYQGVKIGRGALVDTNTARGNLYHNWIVSAPNADVQASFKITDDSGRETIITESGYGYHDHNWGNHPLSSTLERWYWGRISEGDFNIIFAKVYNLVDFPTFKPCIMTLGKDIVTSTEEIEFIEDKVITGVQGLNYAVEGRIKFLEGSGVKGEVKLFDMQLVNEMICYLRFTGYYSIDVETAYGRIKREGKTMFEYMDLAAAVRLKMKMMADAAAAAQLK